MSEGVEVKLNGAARRILIGAGDGNLLDLPAIKALTDAISTPPQGSERLIIIEGQNEDFCAGRAPGKGFHTDISSLELAEGTARPILALYAAVRASRLPVMALVRGRAHGFGCALAVVADITWAEEGATFSLPELDKDLPPTLALTALTPRINAKAAGELVFSRREIGEEEALRIGLCNRVIESHSLELETQALVARLAGNPLRTLATVKAHLAATAYGAHGQMADIASELIAASLYETLREAGE